MRLSDFIRQNHDAIVSEWEDFAQTLRPAAAMTKMQLTNHIHEILAFIADDIDSPQTPEEQFDKSQGRQPDQSPGVDTAAQTHAALRHTDGYDIIEMVAEYRALRASIAKLWSQTHNTLSEADKDDLGRFHEAIDQALAESVVRFTHNTDKAKTLLLGVLGHDIRNPVGTIKMAATLIPHSGPVTERQLQLVNNIHLSIDRVNHIVNDLLDLAKSTAGKTLPLKKNPCSLSKLCQEIVEEMRLRHPDRQFNIMAPEQVDGCWDEIRLGQLLGNLLANAVQYGAPDRPIDVRLTDDGDDVELAVTNEGEPIPPTHLESIFKSFARLPSEGRDREVPTSNLGLGLFISKEIATAHGGTISVASSRAQGTTFNVHLPKFASPRS